MKRVIVTRPLIGICHMAVCAEADCTDEELLEVANRDNPAGTSGGWSRAIREDEPPNDYWPVEKLKPLACADFPDRKHFVLVC